MMQYKKDEIENANLHILRCNCQENINTNDENYNLIIQLFQNLDTSNEKLDYFAFSQYFPEIIGENIRLLLQRNFLICSFEDQNDNLFKLYMC